MCFMVKPVSLLIIILTSFTKYEGRTTIEQWLEGENSFHVVKTIEAAEKQSLLKQMRNPQTQSANSSTNIASRYKLASHLFPHWEKIPVEGRWGGGGGGATSAPPHCVGFVLLIRPHASRIQESENSQPVPLIPHTAAAACDKVFSELWS